MIPTNICTSRNPFALLTDDDDDDTDDNDIPQQAALASSPQANPPPFSRTDSALSDSGASSHFLVDGAHAVNIKVDLNPLTITLPDGRALHSTHTCNLDIPWLRGNATRAHIVPGLTHASLVSTAKFCDAGYTVIFDAAECRILDGTTIVLKGGRDKTTNLWRLPLRPSMTPCPLLAANSEAHTPLNTAPMTPPGRHAMHNVHTLPHIQNRVKFMHQSFFCPPIQTLLRAANLGFLSNIPFLTPELIHKHLTKSPATAKGRLKLRPSGHQST